MDEVREDIIYHFGGVFAHLLRLCSSQGPSIIYEWTSHLRHNLICLYMDGFCQSSFINNGRTKARPLFMNGQVVFNTHVPTTIRVIEHERLTCLFINNGRTMNLSTEVHSILALPLLRQRCNGVLGCPCGGKLPRCW